MKSTVYLLVVKNPAWAPANVVQLSRVYDLAGEPKRGDSIPLGDPVGSRTAVFVQHGGADVDVGSIHEDEVFVRRLEQAGWSRLGGS